MEPTKNPFSRERLVILNKIGRKPSHSKGFLIKYFCEPTATIPKAPGFKEFNVVQRGIYNLHPSSLASKANRGKTGTKGSREWQIKDEPHNVSFGVKRLT